MPEPLRILAGDCTVTYEDADETRRERGKVVTICKPDKTVLVHDADGYQPVAWLTRADAVTISRAEPTTIIATGGDRQLRVTAVEPYGFSKYPVTGAGTPVGDCPAHDCEGALVRDYGDVSCVTCGGMHSIPRDATMTGDTCENDHPQFRVDRGESFEVCIDRDCQPLDDAVQERFDREWDCPNCDGDLLVLRRGGLIAGCEHYPDCDTGFGVPTGSVVEDCDCGLPVFETATGRRCLDTGCTHERSGQQARQRVSK